MATINNAFVHGFSGKIGNFVFRMYGNRQVISVMPSCSKTRTAAQQESCDRFKRAANYARFVLKDPVIKERYAEKARHGNSAYNAAMRDYFNAPEIVEMHTEQYTGLPQSFIAIRAEDDFLVHSVQVNIVSGAGDLVEHGEAILDDKGMYWIYTARNTNTALPDTRILATAIDLPGNTGAMEIILA